jgi:hypothetical protein
MQHGLGTVTNWTEIHPTGTLPPGRAAAGMDYDAIDKIVLLFGGNSSGPVLGDTWLFSLAPRPARTHPAK